MDGAPDLFSYKRAQLVQLTREVYGQEAAAAHTCGTTTDDQIRAQLQCLDPERLRGAIAKMRGDW